MPDGGGIPPLAGPPQTAPFVQKQACAQSAPSVEKEQSSGGPRSRSLQHQPPVVSLKSSCA